LAKRKKKKTSLFNLSFFGGKKSKKRRGKKAINVRSVLTVFGMTAVFVAVGVGFYFLERYVPRPGGQGQLVLINKPEWVNDELEGRLYDIVNLNGGLEINEQTAKRVQQNIEQNFAWVKKAVVRATSSEVLIEALWRKPAVLISAGRKKFYLDGDKVVLDYVEFSGPELLKVTGVRFGSKGLAAGEICELADAAAAVAIVECLNDMDAELTPDNPLIGQVDRIDVSNFNGRHNSRASHILMYTSDNTEIRWGSAIGQWQRNMESTDQEKLAKLYYHYKRNGNSLAGARYINLCDPTERVPQPVDGF